MQKSGASANEQLGCFVPVNKLRDDVFYCLLDEHHCITPPKDTTTYPTCEDKNMTGDASFAPIHILGDWWKVKAWTKGEMYECRPCGRVSFTPYRPLPWPVQPPADTQGYAIIASSWYEKDANGKTWVVNETSLFGPRDGRVGFPTKMNHRGVMYGVSYLENFTIVHDGSDEAEPFLFLYGCGSTIQGAYVTGFVLAKSPVASPALQAKIAQVARQNGFEYFDRNMGQDAWCDVDNTCGPVDFVAGVRSEISTRNEIII